MRGADDETPEAGEHITIVDIITAAATMPTKEDPKKKMLAHHRRLRRTAVTATFFNAGYLMTSISPRTRG